MLVLDDKGSEQTKHKKTFQAKLIKLTKTNLPIEWKRTQPLRLLCLWRCFFYNDTNVKNLMIPSFAERAQDDAFQEKAGSR